MSKTTKKPAVPSPQFVIFDPPIEGYEARAEIRPAKNGEMYYIEGIVHQEDRNRSTRKFIVLTPVKRIEDLLPQNLKCEAWACQDEDGCFNLFGKNEPEKSTYEWIMGGDEDGGYVMLSHKDFNPFGLPVSENPDWKSQLYHFTPAQGWRKVEAK